MAEFKSISKKYGENVLFDNFSLTAESGTKTVIMGESGCGKTTLLRIAAGLTDPDSGEFVHHGKIAIMFQDPRLLPWKNVLGNIRAVLYEDHFSLADKYLSAVGLADSSEKLPSELSGGMAQRVAFARFLAFAEATQSDLLLLDEPFASLDKDTASNMIDILLSFSEGRTLILVTHDPEQASRIGERIVRL